MSILSFIKNRMHRYTFYFYANSINLCQWIKDNISNKSLRRAGFVVISPYLVLCFIIREIADRVIGGVRILLERNNKNFKDRLSIVAIAKNEGPYIKEWIEFHKLVGVTRFYIYDNESEDDLENILAPYIASGEVIYKFFPGKSRQLFAYNDALHRYRDETEYMAFIDLDEYLMPGIYGELLPDIIERIMKKSKHAAGIGVTWHIFGSSGYVKKPKGLITENYLKRGKDKCWQNFHIKTVCNPRKVSSVISPHFAKYKVGYWCINECGRRLRAWFPLGQCFDKIKINHYFCKSQEEALEKWKRGLADRTSKYDWTKFEQYDLNDVHDESMLPYIANLKKNLGEV